MQTQAITALPDFDAVEVALTHASQSLGVMRQQHRRGLITEHELAERSVQGLITAMKDLARILSTMEGPVPERPWPLGTALSMPHQGIKESSKKFCVCMCVLTAGFPCLKIFRKPLH